MPAISHLHIFLQRFPVMSSPEGGKGPFPFPVPPFPFPFPLCGSLLFLLILVGGGVLAGCQSHSPLALPNSSQPRRDLHTHKNVFFSPNKYISPQNLHPPSYTDNPAGLRGGGGPALTWPVRLSSRYKLSQRYHPFRSFRRHLGIDIAGPRGDLIYAAHSGRVIYSGRAFRGFGKVVLLKKPNSPWSSLYAHLKDIYVSQGQILQKGQVLGTLGNTGKTTGSHLHFELRKNKKTVNPLKYLP